MTEWSSLPIGFNMNISIAYKIKILNPAASNKRVPSWLKLELLQTGFTGKNGLNAHAALFIG
jgi:hypothetical protein